MELGECGSRGAAVPEVEYVGQEGERRWKKMAIPGGWEWILQVYRGGWKQLYNQFDWTNPSRDYWLREGFRWNEAGGVWLRAGKTPFVLGYDVVSEALPLPPSDDDWDDSEIWDFD
jgi:hypothetical protein